MLSTILSISMELLRDVLYSSVYRDEEIVKLRRKLLTVDGNHLIFQGRKGRTYRHGSFRFNGKLCSVHTLWWRLSGRQLPRGHYLRNTCERDDCIKCQHLKPVRY